MKILLVGGSGFIGRQIELTLVGAGHQVTSAGRRGASGFGADGMTVDLAADSKEDWQSRVVGFDVVVNAAGVVRDVPGNRMTEVHAKGPMRLFEACREAGVKRVIHVSALGADGGATAFQVSKAVAEQALLAGSGDRMQVCVVRPSLVIGRGGASTRLLGALSIWPLLPRLGDGTWKVQPLHVEDLAHLVRHLVEIPEAPPRTVEAAGPEVLGIDQLILALRQWLGADGGCWIPVPVPLLSLSAWLGKWLSRGPINPQVLTMLRAGNIATPTDGGGLAGFRPRPVSMVLAQHPSGPGDRLAARLYFLAPTLRLSLAALWIATGLLCLLVYPLADSLDLVAAAGITGDLALVAILAGSLVDLVLGLLLLVRWRPVWVGAAQLAAMATFSAISLSLPLVYWIHPFAPLLKNLPIAVATLVMMATEADDD